MTPEDTRTGMVFRSDLLWRMRGKYKRRMLYKPSSQYIVQTCVNHLTDKNGCS